MAFHHQKAKFYAADAQKWLRDEHYARRGDYRSTPKVSMLSVWNTIERAAVGGHLSILKWLHAQGKWHPSNQDYDGSNVAHYALFSPRLQILQWIHSLGLLDPHTESSTQFTSVSRYAAECGLLDILKWLFAVDLLDENSNRFTIAFHAACTDHLEVIEWMAEQDVLYLNPTPQNQEDRTVAHVAPLKILKWLHAQGMLNVTNKDKKGRTPAYYADLETLKWMRSIGILTVKDAMQTDYNGLTIALYAADLGHLSIVHWLQSVGMLK